MRQKDQFRGALSIKILLVRLYLAFGMDYLTILSMLEWLYFV